MIAINQPKVVVNFFYVSFRHHFNQMSEGSQFSEATHILKCHFSYGYRLADIVPCHNETTMRELKDGILPNQNLRTFSSFGLLKIKFHKGTFF